MYPNDESSYVVQDSSYQRLVLSLSIPQALLALLLLKSRLTFSISDYTLITCFYSPSVREYYLKSNVTSYADSFSAPHIRIANSTTLYFPAEFEAFMKNDFLVAGVFVISISNEGEFYPI